MESIDLKNSILKLKKKFPDRIPVFCAPNKKSKDKKQLFLEKNKYLVPADTQISRFAYIIRKRLEKIENHEALYFFCNDSIPPGNTTLSSLYEKNKSDDGLLYIYFDKESTFGNKK